MGTIMNRRAFQALIDEDLAWLRQQPSTLEREHVARVLGESVKRIYGTGAPLGDSERWWPDADVADYAVAKRFAAIAARFPDDADVHWLLRIADAAWMCGEGEGYDACWGGAACPTILDGTPHNPVCVTLRTLLGDGALLWAAWDAATRGW